MKIASFEPTKLCHLTPGDCVRITTRGGALLRELFMVCRHTLEVSKRAPSGASNGLYSEENPLFLISLSSGEARPLPHLSSYVQRVGDAYVVIASDVPQTATSL